MTNILSTLSAIGALTMAATPLVAIASSAHAEAAPVRVMVADLHLSSPADAARFRSRVNMASQGFCAQDVGLNARSCRQAVQDEAVDGLSTSQRQELRSAEAVRS